MFLLVFLRLGDSADFFPLSLIMFVGDLGVCLCLASDFCPLCSFGVTILMDEMIFIVGGEGVVVGRGVRGDDDRDAENLDRCVWWGGQTGVGLSDRKGPCCSGKDGSVRLSKAMSFLLCLVLVSAGVAGVAGRAQIVVVVVGVASNVAVGTATVSDSCSAARGGDGGVDRCV